MSFSWDSIGDFLRPHLAEAFAVPPKVLKTMSRPERRKMERRAKLIDTIISSPQTIERYVLGYEPFPSPEASNGEVRAFIIRRHLDTDRVMGSAADNDPSKRTLPFNGPTKWLVFGKNGWRLSSKRRLK